MLNNSEFLGNLAILETEKRANELEYIVSKPSIPVRYDLIIHEPKSNRIYKVQVKYTDSRPANSEGVLRVKLQKRGKRYQKHEVDILIIYLAPIKKLIWLTPDLFHNKRELCIRFEKSRRYDSPLPSIWFEKYLW